MGNRKKPTAETAEGSAAAANGKFSLISHEKLTALYTNLLKCRVLNQQSAKNGHLRAIRGWEAVLVGATIDLGMGDTVCFDEHGVAGGLSSDAMIADVLLPAANRLSGAVGEAKNGKSAAAHTRSAIGTALANKTQVNKKVALVLSGKDNVKGTGEALHIAAVHSLPMVFVHQAGGEKALGIPERKKKQQTPWFPHITVDRDDVVAMYRVASEALSRARRGGGPTLIECVPLRVNDQSGARNGRHGHDPVRTMEHYLRTRDLFDPAIKVDLLARLQSR